MPKDGTDMSAWAVVACDQFTSEAEYWEKLKEYVGGRPSALELILPEIYLSQRGAEEKVAAAMRRYLKDGVFKKTEKGLILTVRSTPYVGRRIGLVGAVDLEEYDYSPNSSALIRATEATIEERIPPRMKIRKNAPAEFSHIMLLYDDASRSLNEKLYERRAEFEKIYDFDLNMDGGHVEGYFIRDCEGILSAFAQLGTSAGDFLFAAGDGNHSLATAKEHWNELKKDLSEEKGRRIPRATALRKSSTFMTTAYISSRSTVMSAAWTRPRLPTGFSVRTATLSCTTARRSKGKRMRRVCPKASPRWTPR